MILSDARILLQLLRGQPRRGSHAERLQDFYAPQAHRYDEFRDRLLQGREALVTRLQLPRTARLAELGAGTGRNLLYFGDRLAGFEQVDLVDLCPALLAQARRRTAAMANVRTVLADASVWQPEKPLDAVYFAYSLTMIPDWRRAIDNAAAMLKPGGLLGVVDFYVSAARAPADRVQHGTLCRAIWPRWFGHDGVRLNPRHLDYLHENFPAHELQECRARLPYLPGIRVPYYVFVGRKQRRTAA